MRMQKRHHLLVPAPRMTASTFTVRPRLLVGLPRVYRPPKPPRRGGQGAETFDATLYAGIRLWRGAEVWINPELDQGFHLTTPIVWRFVSGEAFELGFRYPYARLQRLFLRQTIKFGGDVGKLDADINQFADTLTANHLVLTVGRMFVTDIFDTNKYANSSKTD